MVVDELDTVRIHDGLRQIDRFFLNNSSRIREHWVELFDSNINGVLRPISFEQVARTRG